MFFLAAFGLSFTNDNDLRLWYTKESSTIGTWSGQGNAIWQENSLPIGNGKIGANVFGEVQKEYLTLNEETLWAGGPSKRRPNYIGGNVINNGKYGQTVKEIQKLFFEGNDKDASNRCGRLTGSGDGYGFYYPIGGLNITFPITEFTDYVRYLDLDKAILTVEFKKGATKYKREYLVSHPANVLAIKLSKEGSGKISFDLELRPIKLDSYKVQVNGNTIEIAGELSDNQMKHHTLINLQHKGGSITANENYLTLSNADEAVIYMTAKTDYKMVYPKYRSGETAEDLKKNVTDTMNAAVAKGYDKIRAEHLIDYQSLFNRVKINLSHVPSTKPTDELLKNYKNGKGNTAAEDRDLEVMLFQFGRYLTLGSSREDSQLPSNLQGIWNDKLNPPWSADFHMNINLQMNYFPTYVTDLPECAIPLMHYVEGLREPGRVTASIYAGINSTAEKPANGFMAHTQNTPFGWTCPGWSFDWGWSPAAVPWIIHNCVEHYEFTLDKEILRDLIYPALKEEAIFYQQMVVPENKTSPALVSSPTYSPEIGPKTNGNVYEQSLIYQLYTNSIMCAEALGTDQELIKEWKELKGKLKFPIEVGDSGQIKEWFHETKINSVAGTGGHRHLSNLLGLYPLNIISIDTPEWIAAAKVTLRSRGDSSTGWGMGHRINCWARTGDGEHAHLLIKNLFKGGIYKNLWDTHPPFQIDGNFAATSGIAEMLIQSNLKDISLLPSIPAVWNTGSFEGLVARGNFKFNLTWKKGTIKHVSILARRGGTCRLYLPNFADAFVKDSEGYNVPTTVTGEERISFETKPGERYVIDRTIPMFRKEEEQDSGKFFEKKVQMTYIVGIGVVMIVIILALVIGIIVISCKKSSYHERSGSSSCGIEQDIQPL